MRNKPYHDCGRFSSARLLRGFLPALHCVLSEDAVHRALMSSGVALRFCGRTAAAARSFLMLACTRTSSLPFLPNANALLVLFANTLRLSALMAAM